MDERFKKFVINCMIPFPVMLEQAGYEGYSYDGKCFCPFHENYNTPSAKLFKDERGDTLYCFSEQRLYKPTDLIDKGLVKTPVERLFKRLWSQLSQESKDKLQDLYDKPIDVIPDSWKERDRDLLKFKLGETSFEQHLEIIKEALLGDVVK